MTRKMVVVMSMAWSLLIAVSTTTSTTTINCPSSDIDCRLRELNCSKSEFPLSKDDGLTRFLLGVAQRSREFVEHGADPFFFRPSEDDPTGLNMMEMVSPKPFRRFNTDVDEYSRYYEMYSLGGQDASINAATPWENVWGLLLESVFHQFKAGYAGEDLFVDFTNSSGLEKRLQEVVETMAKSTVSKLEPNYDVSYRVGYDNRAGFSVDVEETGSCGGSGGRLCWEFTTDFKEALAALPEIDCALQQCTLPEAWRLFFEDYGTHAPTRVSFGESNSVYIIVVLSPEEEGNTFLFIKSGPRNRDWGALGLCSNPPPSSATLRFWDSFLQGKFKELTMPSSESFKTAIRSFNAHEPRKGQSLTPVQEPAWPRKYVSILN